MNKEPRDHEGLPKNDYKYSSLSPIGEAYLLSPARSSPERATRPLVPVFSFPPSVRPTRAASPRNEAS